MLLALLAAANMSQAQPSIPANQPTDQTAIAGTNVTFSVAATDVPPLVYQWRRQRYRRPQPD